MDLMKLNRAMRKDLHVAQGNCQYQYRLQDTWIESSPAKEGLGIPFD